MAGKGSSRIWTGVEGVKRGLVLPVAPTGLLRMTQTQNLAKTKRLVPITITTSHNGPVQQSVKHEAPAKPSDVRQTSNDHREVDETPEKKQHSGPHLPRFP